MSPRPLDFEFARRRGPGGWAAIALVAIALAFAADLAWSYRALQLRMHELRTGLARSATVAHGVLPAQRLEGEDLAFARDAVRRLATPWDRLFSALESAQGDRVALTSIEPDPDAGVVAIHGEARDYLAALSYVANLAEQKSLRRVHLVRHEPAKGGARAVAFTVSATWLPPRDFPQ